MIKGIFTYNAYFINISGLWNMDFNWIQLFNSNLFTAKMCWKKFDPSPTQVTERSDKQLAAISSWRNQFHPLLHPELLP